MTNRVKLPFRAGRNIVVKILSHSFEMTGAHHQVGAASMDPESGW